MKTATTSVLKNIAHLDKLRLRRNGTVIHAQPSSEPRNILLDYSPLVIIYVCLTIPAVLAFGIVHFTVQKDHKKKHFKALVLDYVIRADAAAKRH